MCHEILLLDQYLVKLARPVWLAVQMLQIVHFNPSFMYKIKQQKGQNDHNNHPTRLKFKRKDKRTEGMERRRDAPHLEIYRKISGLEQRFNSWKGCQSKMYYINLTKLTLSNRITLMAMIRKQQYFIIKKQNNRELNICFSLFF